MDYALGINMDYYKYKACTDAQINLEGVCAKFYYIDFLFQECFGEKRKIFIYLFILIVKL